MGAATDTVIEARRIPAAIICRQAPRVHADTVHRLARPKGIGGKEPWARVNPADATKRQIADGDMMEVVNERGMLRVKARLSQSVPPGVVQMWLGYRFGDYVEGAPTLLQMPLGTAETHDKVCEKWLELTKRRWGPLPGKPLGWDDVARGRLPYTVNLEVACSGAWDVLWDNYCDVRKIE